MAPQEQNFLDLIQRIITGNKMRGEAVSVSTVEEAQLLLHDTGTNFDQVIFGTMGQQWEEIDRAAELRGVGRNLITTPRFDPIERQRILDMGVNIIHKDEFDKEAFINMFIPEGRSQERI